MSARSAFLDLLLRAAQAATVAKFNPNRVPAGSSAGGQFTSGDGGEDLTQVHPRDVVARAAAGDKQAQQYLDQARNKAPSERSDHERATVREAHRQEGRSGGSPHHLFGGGGGGGGLGLGVLAGAIAGAGAARGMSRGGGGGGGRSGGGGGGGGMRGGGGGRGGGGRGHGAGHGGHAGGGHGHAGHPSRHAQKPTRKPTRGRRH